MMKHVKYWLTTPCYVIHIIRKELRQVNRVAHLHIIILNSAGALALHIGTLKTYSYHAGSSVRKNGGELAEHTIEVRW